MTVLPPPMFVPKPFRLSTAWGVTLNPVQVGFRIRTTTGVGFRVNVDLSLFVVFAGLELVLLSRKDRDGIEAAQRYAYEAWSVLASGGTCTHCDCFPGETCCYCHQIIPGL